jgi:hypothetical protein
MRYLATILITFLLAASAMSVEARPRTAAHWNTSLRAANRILPMP